MTNLFKADPFIIAEVGSNWRDFNEAKDAVQMAKQVGADAVKFQLFTPKCLYGFSTGSYIPGQSPFLKSDWLPKLKEKADAAGIEFMCTAFSPPGLQAVDPHVEVHKIASSDLTHLKLLEAAKDTGKPILLSVGGSNTGDIREALDVLGGSTVILLYCNAAYPSKRHNLFNIEKLARLTGKPIGLSDHSIDAIYTPLSAVRHFHVPVIEKHFNPKSVPNTNDAGHSLDADEFKLMVDYIRDRRDTANHMRTSEEHDMTLRHNRRLIAIRDIKQGEKLTYGLNYTAARSLVEDRHGYSPFMLRDPRYSPEGKAAKNNMRQGDSIGPGDF